MKEGHYRASYAAKTEGFLAEHDIQEAMSLSVGGEFEAVGALEFCLLRSLGLAPEHTVIDVGCGSGRLAVQLRDYLTGIYIGMDVVPALYQHAQALCKRPDWRFYTAPGTTIPETDESADFVVFFSVFTHLLHEETYRYLADTVRVLKPGGRIVFSFLEFRIPSHWAVFDASVQDTRPEKVLNQFMDRDMIAGFAERLGLDVVDLHDGDKPHIPLDRAIRWDDGRVMEGAGNLGQSVCVLGKPYSNATT